jgi:hypothetical protein
MSIAMFTYIDFYCFHLVGATRLRLYGPAGVMASSNAACGISQRHHFFPTLTPTTIHNVELSSYSAIDANPQLQS